MVVDWIWRLCNTAFESGVDLGVFCERNECKNYRNIILLSVVEKVYAGILVDRLHKVTKGLINDEQGCSDQGGSEVGKILTLKQIGVKV